jgi:hypothetical protein
MQLQQHGVTLICPPHDTAAATSCVRAAAKEQLAKCWTVLLVSYTKVLLLC